MNRVVVIGVGNVLTGDDALGPTVVSTLDAEWVMEDAVELIDGGTPGMDLATMIHDADGLIVVDTARTDGAPGTLKCWDRDALLSRQLTPRTNPHAPGLLETLWTMQLAEAGPSEVELVGIVPQATEIGVGMCDDVRAAVPAAVDACIRVLTLWGFPPQRRDPPRTPNLWWEVAVTPPGRHAEGLPTRARSR